MPGAEGSCSLAADDHRRSTRVHESVEPGSRPSSASNSPLRHHA